MSPRKVSLYICLGLAALVVAVYGHVWNCDFLDFDDNTHVFANEHVAGGLTWQNAVWAFTHFHAAQWIPLSWISHMADVSLFGLDPGPQHLVAVALHLINSLLVFAVLREFTGNVARAAFVAGLFAIHPINVESVAWIAERKNLLSTLFGLLTIGAYGRYVRTTDFRWYAGMVVMFACSLSSKAMLVTLPCALLLLDVWPLNRVSSTNWRRLVGEKLPLFALSLVACLMQLFAAKHDGLFWTLESSPLTYRIGNASLNVFLYLGKLLWPQNVALIYPLNAPVTPAATLGLLLALLTITVMAWRLRQKAPALLVGWLWFLGIQVPISGLLQVGNAVMADRYMYVPQLGIWFALAWSIPSVLLGKLPLVIRTAGIACVLALAARSHAYVQHWDDTASIFTETARATKGNFLAHSNAGYAYAKHRDYPAAVIHYRAALAIQPTLTETRCNYGIALNRLGQPEAAQEQFKRVLADDPADARARLNIATALISQARQEEAIRLLEAAPEREAGIEHWLRVAKGLETPAAEAERQPTTLQ